MFSYRVPAAAIILAAFAITACDDDDDDPVQPTATVFDVTLTKAQETGTPCAGAGANAEGSATVTINAANTSVAVTNLEYSGLSGPATLAHIHFGATGVAGDPVFTFTAPLTSPINQTFTAANYPATPTAPVPSSFSGFITAMKAGNSYINVHTDACPNGEIRGQLTPD